MENNKRLKRKNFPVEISQVGKFEGWLSTQASKGWFLQSMTNYSGVFVEGNSVEMEYRLEYLPEEDQEEYIDSCRESGWYLVCSYGRSGVFAAAKEFKTVEIHTDYEEQYYLIRGFLQESKRRERPIIWCTVIVFLSWFISSILSGFWFELYRGITLGGPFLSGLALLGIVTLRLSAIRDVEVTLKSGKPIDHHEPIKKNRHIHFILPVISLIGGVYLLFLLCFSAVFSNEKYDLNQNTHMNYIKLTTLNPDVEEDKTAAKRSVELCYFGKTTEIKQASVLDKHAASKEPERLVTTQYHAYSRFLADAMFGEVVEREHNGNLLKQYLGKSTLTQESGFDDLEVYVMKGQKCMIFARIGKDILSVNYTGTAEVDVLLQAVKNYLN